MNTADWDKKLLWHPFTPMRQWCDEQHEPLLMTRGEGCWLYDQHGQRYLDGNSSIWTNIHGHAHPKINAAIKDQLDRVSHTSFLGFTHEPAVTVAQELLRISGLDRVFYSDNGSTAIEAAVRMAMQYWMQNGRPEKQIILSFDAAYHGDTLGAASLGGISLFKGSANQFGYQVLRFPDFEALEGLEQSVIDQSAAIIIEPLIQGSAGMRLWPKGMLKRLEHWCREHDVFLILDEVMTGFGRTGKMFACEHEQVSPDFLCLAKGLTGGYLPMAATLTTSHVFDGFLGEVSEGRTFFYGHSYTASQLGCAAASASLQIFREEKVLVELQGKIEHFSTLLQAFADHPHVKEVRQCGLIAGIELEAPYGTGVQVCMAARQYGLLTRPILNTLVLMPPLCVSPDELSLMTSSLMRGIQQVLA